MGIGSDFNPEQYAEKTPENEPAKQEAPAQEPEKSNPQDEQ